MLEEFKRGKCNCFGMICMTLCGIKRYFEANKPISMRRLYRYRSNTGALIAVNHARLTGAIAQRGSARAVPDRLGMKRAGDDR